MLRVRPKAMTVAVIIAGLLPILWGTDAVDSRLAARAYINPLAAQMMLTRYPPRGKRVLLTAAGSDCAILLGQWARQAGAEAVYGIHRSAVHAERLEAMGITPVAQHDANRIGAVAARSDIVYDATAVSASTCISKIWRTRWTLPTAWAHSCR